MLPQACVPRSRPVCLATQSVISGMVVPTAWRYDPIARSTSNSIPRARGRRSLHGPLEQTLGDVEPDTISILLGDIGAAGDLQHVEGEFDHEMARGRIDVERARADFGTELWIHDGDRAVDREG